MEKPIETAHVPADITQEPYKGPSATIASLGYSFLDFKIATFASLAAGVAAAVFAPKQSATALRNFTNTTQEWKASTNLLKRGTGWLMNGWASVGHWATDHFPFGETIAAKIGKDSWEAGSKVGGMIAGVSFLGTLFSGIGRGIKVAHRGRDQFETAKQEIKDLRAENSALRNKNATLATDSANNPIDDAIQASSVAQLSTSAEHAVSANTIPTPKITTEGAALDATIAQPNAAQLLSA